jgi:hypothetical protein
MIFRRNRAGFGIALSTALFCFGFTKVASAQDPLEEPAKTEDPPKEDPPSAPAEEAPKEEPAASAETEVKAEVEAPKAAPPDAAPAETSGAPASDPELDKARFAVGVERLSGSAYPAPRTRGIPGGSLAGTMHGLQWPYLPAVGGTQAVRLGLSGSVWSDGSYATIDAGLKEAHGDQKRLTMQSRAVLRASPTYSRNSGWFAQGQAELVALGDQATTPVMGFTDDLYVRIGKWNVFDLTAGRFQSWEIANHYGMGLDLNTLEREGANIRTADKHPKPAYGLTYFWDRADLNLGSYAVHLYSPAVAGLPPNILRVELLTQLGAGRAVSPGGVQTSFRPSGILDLGYVKVKGGFEYGVVKPDDQRQQYKGKNSRNGVGFAVQGVFDPYVEAGVAWARGYEDVIGGSTGLVDEASSNVTTGVSGFLNARIIGSLIIGGGVLYSHWVNYTVDERPGSLHFGEHDYDQHFQTFGALQYTFWDVFSAKFVGAYAHWRHQDRSSTPFANTLKSGRLRLAMAF